MIAFPNCKVNLGLNILRKRMDGFHDLETVFLPILIRDALEAIPSSGDNDTFTFTSSGLPITGNEKDNLCIKAYELLKKNFPEIPLVKMHLHKTIPMGAGLGGGSADGAFTLKLLNRMFQLNQTEEQLIELALQLGSDCPFFIINKPCFASGRGEVLTQIEPAISSYKVVIINPGIHINTGWAFSQITPTVPAKSIKDIIQQPIMTWKEELKNDFETPVFTLHPEIKDIKETLYQEGAVYAAMSGTGSSVFGIFDQNAIINRNHFSKNHFFQESICQV